MHPDTTPFNILLAEDNSADVTLVRQALREHHVDCKLQVMRDGEEAIKWLERLDNDQTNGSLDLILLDMYLPKQDGESILRCVRGTRHYAQTPVILMTSLDTTVLKPSLNAALVYFTKPSSLDEFMRLGSIVKKILLADHPKSSAARTDVQVPG